jgi:UDP-2-acetamido-3-amino-2,3-dideoxy-glucuronate N-acetyltransferase
MAGVPAKQIGWMSRFGEKIDFSNSNEWICKSTNDRYVKESEMVKVML